MPACTWKTYVDSFDDWDVSVRAERIAELSDFGPSEEAAELILELASDDQASGECLLAKAADSGVQFSAKELCLFSGVLDEAPILHAMMVSVPRFTKEDTEELYAVFGEEAVRQVCRVGQLPLPCDLQEEEDEATEEIMDFENPDTVYPYIRLPKLHFPVKIAAALVHLLNKITGNKK